MVNGNNFASNSIENNNSSNITNMIADIVSNTSIINKPKYKVPIPKNNVIIKKQN